MKGRMRSMETHRPRCPAWLTWLWLAGALCVATSPSTAAEGAPPVRGLLKPLAESDLSVQIAARVAEIPLREGQSFHRGDVLLRFDCSLLEAERKAAQAAYKARELKARSKRRLLAYQAAGRLDAAIATAEAEQAKAEASRASLRVQQCKVRAPYDGWIVARHVDVSETPQVGAKLITIVRNGPLEVEMIVPTAWLKWLRPNEPFVFLVDGLDVRLKGRVTRLGAVAEQVSQTIRIYGEVDNPPSLVRAGMTGQVTFIRRKRAVRSNTTGKTAEDGA